MFTARIFAAPEEFVSRPISGQTRSTIAGLDASAANSPHGPISMLPLRPGAKHFKKLLLNKMAWPSRPRETGCGNLMMGELPVAMFSSTSPRQRNDIPIAKQAERAGHRGTRTPPVVWQAGLRVTVATAVLMTPGRVCQATTPRLKATVGFEPPRFGKRTPVPCDGAERLLCHRRATYVRRGGLRLQLHAPYLAAPPNGAYPNKKPSRARTAQSPIRVYEPFPRLGQQQEVVGVCHGVNPSRRACPTLEGCSQGSTM